MSLLHEPHTVLVYKSSREQISTADSFVVYFSRQYTDLEDHTFGNKSCPLRCCCTRALSALDVVEGRLVSSAPDVY